MCGGVVQVDGCMGMCLSEIDEIWPHNRGDPVAVGLSKTTGC